MRTTYFEELARAELREADRLMLFAALRCRSAQPASRSIIANLLWLLGVTR